MNAKNKAKELIDSFKLGQLKVFDHTSDMYTYVDKNKYAKECALLCCDEVLGYMGSDRGYVFWTTVKKEIKKL